VGGTVAPSRRSGTISAPSSAVASAAALQRAGRTMTRGKHREPAQRDLSCPTTTATSLAGFIGEVETIIQRWTPPRVDWYISPWFRGHSNVEWDLDPGWYRQAAPGRKKGDAWYSEHNLLLEFKLRAPRYLPAQPATDWHWLFVMQHYGLPTRLLDWTESALLGLYFAVRENRQDTDAAVWVLNPWWLNNRSLQRREIPLAGDSQLAPWAPLSKRGRLEGTLPVAIRPVHGTQRIATQKGFFTVHGKQRGALNTLSTLRVDNGPGLHLLRIPADAIVDIQRQLAIAGVTETPVFHDLDGLCREIKAAFFGV
jgi:hypothetical protein